ncbi:MAG: MBL fold metallo-hydrolase [Polyangiaceae bacterium]
MAAHTLDVGQGAATLGELPCAAVLVDTGGEKNDDFDSGRALEAALDAFFARRSDLDGTLALLVITHPHIDHTRNIGLVTGRYRVDNVVTNGQERGSGGPQQRRLQTWARDHARLETIRSDAVPAGGRTSTVIDPVVCAGVDPEVRVLWGEVVERPASWNKEAFDNANNHSVVVRLGFGRASFLITGDLEQAGAAALVSLHARSRVLDVDVWQVSHHGAENALADGLLAAITPVVSTVPSGPPWRERPSSAWEYGHPRWSTVGTVAAATRGTRPARDVAAGVGKRAFERTRVKRAVYATGWDGAITVEADASGRYQVRTAR